MKSLLFLVCTGLISTNVAVAGYYDTRGGTRYYCEEVGSDPSTDCNTQPGKTECTSWREVRVTCERRDPNSQKSYIRYFERSCISYNGCNVAVNRWNEDREEFAGSCGS